jgi:hypothetical protein
MGDHKLQNGQGEEIGNNKNMGIEKKKKLKSREGIKA